MSGEDGNTAGRLLAFGAHPDDLEFGAGGILVAAASAGMQIELVLGSRGEAGTNGTPEEREREARAAAARIGADLSWVDLGGDAHMAQTIDRVMAVAAVIRRVRPDLVLAPTVVEDQHPDHVVVGKLVRDALRLARYGKIEKLIDLAPWRVERFYQYAVTPSAEPAGGARMVVDISTCEAEWIELMRCHASQLRTRRYVDLQIARARGWGLQAGVELAQVLFAATPLRCARVVDLPPTVRHL